MKKRIMAITVIIAVFAAFSSAPRVEAEPLTIMAIVGVATVLTISSVDIVANNYDDNKEMRAQEDGTKKLLVAKAETAAPASNAVESQATAQP
jgi:hypothetical protein